MALATTAGAVKISTNGVGEVILVPYYTVQGENSTLLSITNVSNQVKAVKVRFMESQHGLSAGSVNLYLPPNDMWTGNIVNNGEGAKVITYDPSCTVPVVGENGFALNNLHYQSDQGDAGLGRTKEGYVEILDMGVVTDPSLVKAISFDGAKPDNCSLVVTSWGQGGKWRVDPNDGMNNEFGDLMAQANIINVQDGVEYSQPLTVLTEFSDSSTALHTAPQVLTPSLESASPAHSKNPDENWSKSIDAVSGLLMAENLFNEFTVNGAVSATSEWNITFPTKHFYTDVEGNRQPFTSKFGVDGACEAVQIKYWNRDTKTQTEVDSLDLCYAANIVKLAGAVGGSSIFHSQNSEVEFQLLDVYANGWAKFDFVTLGENPNDPPAVGDYEGHIIETGTGSLYAGLPAIGFSASRLGNKNVGVGAAYASVSAHKFTPSAMRALVDPACVGDASVCVDKELDITTSKNYDATILPKHRNVYGFHTPKKPTEGRRNFIFYFSVVDHGAEVNLNLGLSKVKGRVQPEPGDVVSCYTGPGTELSFSAATDGQYTKCLMEYDRDYYFTIENLDDIKGGYRFSFKEVMY